MNRKPRRSPARTGDVDNLDTELMAQLEALKQLATVLREVPATLDKAKALAAEATEKLHAVIALIRELQDRLHAIADETEIDEPIWTATSEDRGTRIWRRSHSDGTGTGAPSMINAADRKAI
jgi:chromosome segregation ATPase